MQIARIFPRFLFSLTLCFSEQANKNAHAQNIFVTLLRLYLPLNKLNKKFNQRTKQRITEFIHMIKKKRTKPSDEYVPLLKALPWLYITKYLTVDTMRRLHIQIAAAATTKHTMYKLCIPC